MNIFNRVRARAVRFLSPSHRVIEAVKPFTLLTEDRLESLLGLSRQVVEARVAGAFVECGTYRGGSGAILGYVAKQEGWKRDLYLFDSFQGHPSFASADAPDRDGIPQWTGKLVASQEDVKAALRRVGAYDANHVRIVPGWFQQSLPAFPIAEIALLHLDADWYDSTLFCLKTLFGRVVPGGYIQVDDYYLYEGCRLAVDEFMANQKQVCFRQVGIAQVISKK
jgi:O-methyltransferase